MYAVITGASSGFGTEFARQFAKRGYDLCIAARRENKLIELKTELVKAYGITVDVFAVDLSDSSGPKKLHDFTAAKKPDVLINNSGIATNGMPGHTDLEEEMRMLDVNVRAMHILMRLFLDDMLKRDSGRILNVSSLSGWLPVPGLAAYSAGKSYILNLSEAVNYELTTMDTKVRVSVVTPGFLNTGIAGDSMTMKDTGRSVPSFVARVTEKFLAGKSVIVLGEDKKVSVVRRLFSRKVAEGLLMKSVSQVLQAKA
jgi:uncharacterized protein